MFLFSIHYHLPGLFPRVTVISAESEEAAWTIYNAVKTPNETDAWLYALGTAYEGLASQIISREL
jgi:hypothetical protein